MFYFSLRLLSPVFYIGTVLKRTGTLGMDNIIIVLDFLLLLLELNLKQFVDIVRFIGTLRY